MSDIYRLYPGIAALTKSMVNDPQVKRNQGDQNKLGEMVRERMKKMNMSPAQFSEVFRQKSKPTNEKSTTDKTESSDPTNHESTKQSNPSNHTDL